MVEIDVLRPGYAQLLQRIVDWAKAHDSIDAMFVSGSVGEGTADAFSDLDLVVVVDRMSRTLALLAAAGRRPTAIRPPSTATE